MGTRSNRHYFIRARRQQVQGGCWCFSFARDPSDHTLEVPAFAWDLRIVGSLPPVSNHNTAHIRGLQNTVMILLRDKSFHQKARRPAGLYKYHQASSFQSAPHLNHWMVLAKIFYHEYLSHRSILNYRI
jgi:hypothetical protein